MRKWQSSNCATEFSRGFPMTEALARSNLAQTWGHSIGPVLTREPPGTPFLVPGSPLCFVFSERFRAVGWGDHENEQQGLACFFASPALSRVADLEKQCGQGLLGRAQGGLVKKGGAIMSLPCSGGVVVGTRHPLGRRRPCLCCAHTWPPFLCPDGWLGLVDSIFETLWGGLQGG